MTAANLTRNRYLVLLAILVAGLIAQSLPFPRADYMRQIATSIGTVAVLVVVFTESRHRMLAVWAGAAGVAAAWAQQVMPAALLVPIELAHNALMILLFALGVTVILHQLFQRRSVRVDDIIGTLCGYLLLGAIWTNLYSVVDLLFPGSFSVPPQMQAMFADSEGRHAVFNYFSLVTLTTVGFGDVTATRGPATIVVALEALIGQFYIAVVVAQLVGIKLAQITSTMPQDRGGEP